MLFAGWRRWGVALVGLLLLGLAVLPSAGAQSTMMRFFGFFGDISIADQPLSSGDIIQATIGGDVVGRAVVNDAGHWFLDVRRTLIRSNPCNLEFVVNGLVADITWPTCPARVRFNIRGPEPPGGALEPEGSDLALEDDVVHEMAEGSGDGRGQMSMIVRPDSPKTGTGGLLRERASAGWEACLASVGVTLVVIGGLVAFIRRRTRGYPEYL